MFLADLLWGGFDVGSFSEEIHRVRGLLAAEAEWQLFIRPKEGLQ